MKPVRITSNWGRIKTGVRYDKQIRIFASNFKKFLYGIIYLVSGCFFWCTHSEPDPDTILSTDQ